MADPNHQKQSACGQCGMVFNGKLCPSCGAKALVRNTFGPPAKDMKKARDELLSRYDGSQEPKFKKETTWRIWQKCVFMALHRNQTVQHAKILFKKFHGSWPEKTPELRGSVPAWEHNGDPIANHKSAMLTPPNGKDFDHGDEETTR